MHPRKAHVLRPLVLAGTITMKDPMTIMVLLNEGQTVDCARIAMGPNSKNSKQS